MPTRYFGCAVGAENRDFDGVQEAQTSMGCLDGFFGNLHHLTAIQHRAVFRHEEAGLLLRKEIVVASPDCRAAVDAQRLFLGLVPADEPQVLGVLDEEHDRQVFEHRVQETPGIFEFSRPPRQRLFRPLVLGSSVIMISAIGARRSWLVARRSGFGASSLPAVA